MRLKATNLSTKARLNRGRNLAELQESGRVKGMKVRLGGTRTPLDRLAQKRGRGLDTTAEERAVASRSHRHRS